MAKLRKPPQWDEERLERDRSQAIELFRRERLEEPLNEYLEQFDRYRVHLENLLEATVDLSQINERALDILTDPRLLEAFRYLAGPPISEDDLKILAEVSLAPTRLKKDPELVRRVVEVVLLGLDRRRFTWVSENRDPTAAERDAAILASAALIAANRTATSRRTEGKGTQEGALGDYLLSLKLTRVDPREIHTLSQAPKPGEFCGESMLGRDKADFVVTLWDTRVMPIECKVSNSSTNSIKRLNHDAVAKTSNWLKDFGTVQVVPTAVLTGVYKLRNLVEAQNRGLTLFWSHDLAPLGDWISRAR